MSPRSSGVAEGTALALLLVLAAAAWVERPGAVFEVATIGLAGAGLWAVVAAERPGFGLLAVIGLAFVVPLSNTWPGRVWTLAIQHAPTGVDALFAPATLALAVALVANRHSVRRGHAPWSLRIAAILFVAATAISTAIAGSREAAGFALLEFLVPLAIGALVIKLRPAVDQAWLILTALLAGVSVPAVVGIGSYILQLGLPTSPADVALGKSRLDSALLFQKLTYGNVDHFTTLAVLLLPVAILGATRHGPGVQRAIAGTAAVLLIAIVLLVMSRLAVAVMVAEIVTLAVVEAVRGRRLAAGALAAASALVLLMFVNPSFRHVFTGTSTTLTAQVPAGAASTETGPGGSGSESVAASKETVDISASFRAGAIRTGLHVFEHHAPFGVGTGLYPKYDPVHTAAHSLVVEMLAENGILGVTGLAALLWFTGLGLVRFLTGRVERHRFELQLACLLGSLAFLGTAILGGVQLTDQYVDIWPVAFAILAAIAAGGVTSNADVEAT